MIDSLHAIFIRLINNLSFDTYRYLYHNFTIKNRLTGIVGPRGVGKTTLMLQYIKDNFYDNREVFYFSADHIFFNKTSIWEFVEELYQAEGINKFFIDEIHKYNNWDQELKNIYDSFPEIRIVFSGSSSIDLIKGTYDLSRRGTIYYLQGLSFREYINFITQSNLKVIDFESLINEHVHHAEILSQVPKIKGLFREYIKQGYYPFLLEDHQNYYQKILSIIEKTIYEDISSHYTIKTSNLHYFKKILYYLSTIPPGEINTHNIAKNLGIDHKTAYHYLTILKETGLIRMLYSYDRGSKLIRKPEKIFLNNTTLLYAICESLGQNADLGTIRELFFINSLANAGIDIYYNDNGDFRSKSIIFEIGGRSKSNKQVRNAKLPAYIVKDNILIGRMKEIPLYLFGFLY